MSMSGENKKCLLFTLEFPPHKGGISKYYKNLAKYWPNDGLSVLTEGRPCSEDADNIIRRRLLNPWMRPRWLPSLFHLYKLSTDRHIIVGQILPLGLAAYLLSKISKREYSVILHGLDFSLAINRRRMTAKILKRAAKVICANGYTASLVKAFDSSLAPKTVVVNPGIEPQMIRNPAKVNELKEKHGLKGKKIIFGLGRLVKRKGFDKAIEAMSLVVEKDERAILVIAGAGPEEENLKKKILSLPDGKRDRIILVGPIEDEEYWAWLELCDIFIMASRNIAGDYEGFGIVYLEANLAGKPVIAGDSGGVRDAVLDNVNGLLVNPESQESIAQAMLDLLENERLCQELGSAGNRRVVETMSAKKQAEKFSKTLLS